MSGPVPTQAEWPDACVAIVDDEEPIRRVLADMLRVRGYTNVVSFPDGTALLEAYDDLAPDLILLDLHMPGVDGVAVLERLAERPEADRAPIIVMTGGGQREHARQTLALGAADFLSKPVDSVELLLRVRHQLRERRLRRELAQHGEHLERLVEERAGELWLLSRVLDAMPLPAFVLADDLKLHYANAGGEELLVDAERDIGRALATDDRQRELLLAVLQDLDETPRRVQSAIVDAQGRTRRVEVSAKRVDEGFLTLLVHDVEEQELTRDTLQRALVHEMETAQRMRNLEDLRTRFLSAVSHELRTPLTIILGGAESLERRGDWLSQEQRDGLVTRLHRNAQRLHRLLDDLLDLNRLSAGRLTVHPERHDLADLVREALDEVELDDRPLELHLEPCHVEVEERQIRRAIANLLRNAVVHTPSGTPIEVRLTHEGEAAQMTVADHGHGVADALKDRIFEPFEQGPTAPSHQPGTGIGLALVREFVELHAGRITLTDTPGGGATFVIELPLPDG